MRSFYTFYISIHLEIRSRMKSPMSYYMDGQADRRYTLHYMVVVDTCSQL